MFRADAERAADLQASRAGLRPRGDRRGRRRRRLRRPRERRGDGGGLEDPSPRPLGVGAAARAREPARLPPLRPADRPRRQRLPLLRPAPAGAGRGVVSRGGRAAAALLSVAVVSFGALVGFGCGDDDSGDEVTIPEISIETTETTTAPATTGSTSTEPQNGGTGFDPNQPDSQGNDKPPKPGSPEAAFEEQCKQNPAACG